MPGKQGLIFIISAPSGAGKTTLADSIIARDERFVHPVSYTTRAPRNGEKTGHDYRFVSPEQFMKLWGGGHFFERARVHGAWYATSKKDIRRCLDRGKYVLLTIDVQGAGAVARACPREAVRVFLLPPNRTAWLARLKKRGEKDFIRRTAHAEAEFKRLPCYDYCLVNDKLEKAADDFFAIVRAEELRRMKSEAGRMFLCRRKKKN
ncbi:MAG: guanylate kinase [Elusimicrobia bacterium]|nr:guanylate kinase [Elusimicrobiota bacterium]